MCTFQLFRLLSRVERPLWSCAFPPHTAFSPRYFSRILPTSILLSHACKNTAGGGLIVEIQQAPISPWSDVQFCMLIYQHPENYHEGKNKGICHLNYSAGRASNIQKYRHFGRVGHKSLCLSGLYAAAYGRQVVVSSR